MTAFAIGAARPMSEDDPLTIATRVLRVDPADPAADAVEQATGVLRAGGLVAFPTETFYGLGAAALDPRAVARIFTAKGRPASKPLLVLVDGIAMAEAIAEVSDAARALMARHWPGALTLVMEARAVLPDDVTAKTGTIGVRLSAHPVASALVRGLGGPVTAPSANLTGAAPCTTAAEVLAALDGRLELILDGGPTAGGLPSTVLDVTVTPPRLIRPGAIRP